MQQGRAKQRNPLNLYSIIFATIGLCLLIAGLWSIKETYSFRSNAVETTAIIQNIISEEDTTKQLLISYTANEIEYNNVGIKYFSTASKIGDEIKIYYNKTNPSYVLTQLGSYMFGLVFAVIGGGFFISALFARRGMRKRKEEVNRLINSGKYVTAIINKIELNKSMHIGGRNPYYLECLYSDEAANKKYRFVSDNLWIPPEEALLGSEIKVFIETNDMKKYYIDIRNFEGIENPSGLA